MDASIQLDKAIKTLNRNKVGEDVLFAYDETKRMVAVCASAKVSPMSLVNVGILTCCVTCQDATLCVHVRRTLQDASGSGECY